MSQLGYRFVDRTQNLLYSKVRSMDDSYQVNFNAGMYDENVIYNDEDILVVDKPANMQTAPGFISHESLATKMANAYGILRVDRMVVHRLDYATSGVVVFAKNENACKNLHKSFRTSNCVKKVYTSIVAGSLEGKLSGVVDLPIGRDKQRGPPFYKIGQNCSTAKASISHWEVMDCGETASMVRLRPVTGRYSYNI